MRRFNLPEVTYLVRGSAKFQPSALTPEFIPFKHYIGVAQSPTHCKKVDGIFQVSF